MSERFEMGCLHSAAASLENSLLGMNNFRPAAESHVAQQSRREKLRVPQVPSSTPSNQLQDFSHNHHHLFQLPRSYSSLNPGDLGQVRTIKSCGDFLYDPTTAMFTSEMLNYSSSSSTHNNNNSTTSQHVLLADHKDVVLNQESSGGGHGGGGPHQSGRCGGGPDNASASAVSVASFGNSSHMVPTSFRFQSQQSFDWMSNFVNGSSNGGGRSGDVCSSHENPILIGESLAPRNAKDETGFSSVAAQVSYLKPGVNEYQDVQSSLTSNRSSSEISNQDGHRSYGEINFRSPLFYQTNLQQVVTSSSTLGRQGLEMGSSVVVQQHQQQQQQKTREIGHGSWADGGGNELVLLPTNYGNQNDPSQLMEGGNSSSSTHQWNGGEVGFATNKNGSGNLENVVGSDSNPQGLALSLCSNPPPEFRAPHGQFGERFGSENMQTRPAGICGGDSQEVKQNNSGYLVSSSKPIISTVNKSYGSTVENIGGCSTYARQGTGPLGPFTGYATILKNSKFLKPAKQLLEEFCSVAGAPKSAKACEVVSDKSIGDSSNLSDPGSSDNGDGRRGENSGVSSSFFSSNAAGGEGRANSTGACQSYRSDFQQKKAKLMYMLEEVCRRYKQYHQQMQMVVSSFESVAGLDAATPYTSNALKTISSHFRSLKSTIADQLRLMKKALGEDLSSPTSVTNNSKGDATVPRLRFISQSLGKQVASGTSLGFLEQQQQVWRPQRGLPERSVAVLRSWLFEHFLHPYPTDTDKHMLASQTGLTRNQVSNWFINARVRIWKPMVEEMHMLESKGSTEMDISTSMNNQNPVGESNRRSTIEQSYNRHMTNAISEKAAECSTARLASIVEVGQSSEQWHQEKRSRTDCQLQTGILDNGLMSLVPYHQSGLDVGGLGSVSLTLGLRHGTGNAQQQQQRQDHQFSRHFGSHMVHDFVG